MSNYNLPVCDVDRQRRNFPGYSCTVLTRADILEAMDGGTTDTSPGAEQRNDPR